MQDNFDKAWKDKLGGYQAPADPQDWAAMGAMLDAKEEKRAGFFWWSLLGLALLITVGGLSYRFLLPMGNNHHNATSIAGNDHTEDINGTAHAAEGNNSQNQGGNTSNGHDNQPTDGSGSIATMPDSDVDGVNSNTTASGRDKSVNGTNGNNTSQVESSGNANQNNSLNNASNKSSKNGKGKKNPNTLTVKTSGNDNTENTSAGNTSKGRNTPYNTTAWDSPELGAYDNDAKGTGNGSNEYEQGHTSITLKQIKKLPNPTTMAFNKDTSDIKLSYAKPSIVSHYLGFSSGISASRVDRSSDSRTGFNVGLQYSMMIKNRVGLHTGVAYRLYNYFTDLVVCNYNLYQCPNSYSSTVKTIDLYAGLQVNLVKNDKVEWYVMGGVSNQFMLKETFEYNLPPVDTANPAPIPVEPPASTSFTGAGVSNFDESITSSEGFDASTSTSLDPQTEGRFLRERYLGAWYVGTGVTWNFTRRMNLQVEPVIGRSLQFVGIQDKKLWNTGVNVRLNVKLGR